MVGNKGLALNTRRSTPLEDLFDVVFILTEGGQKTETITLYVYRQAIQFNKTSEAAAISYILLFTVIVLTNLYLYLANRRSAQEV